MIFQIHHHHLKKTMKQVTLMRIQYQVIPKLCEYNINSKYVWNEDIILELLFNEIHNLYIWIVSPWVLFEQFFSLLKV